MIRNLVVHNDLVYEKSIFNKFQMILGDWLVAEEQMNSSNSSHGADDVRQNIVA